jgi:hypothetical protein
MIFLILTKKLFFISVFLKMPQSDSFISTIISASITTPSQQSLYPRINLFDASSSLLKGPLTYAKDFADLGMFDLITGKATLKVGTPEKARSAAAQLVSAIKTR